MLSKDLMDRMKRPTVEQAAASSTIAQTGILQAILDTQERILAALSKEPLEDIRERNREIMLASMNSTLQASGQPPLGPQDGLIE